MGQTCKSERQAAHVCVCVFSDGDFRSNRKGWQHALSTLSGIQEKIPAICHPYKITVPSRTVILEGLPALLWG